jgi:glutaredoxin
MSAPVPTHADTISVYWQTGCTSCLRTKEFLTKHGVAFRSRNVLEDDTALDELARFGLRQVPIVVRGDDWANGQILRDVAKLCGIPLGNEKILPPPELHRRINTIINATQANVLQLPHSALSTHLPNRPRSYADLAYHIFNIVDAFVEHEEGIPLVYEAYYRLPPPDMQTPQGLADYGAHVAKRFNDWFAAMARRPIGLQRRMSIMASSRCTISSSAPPGTADSMRASLSGCWRQWASARRTRWMKRCSAGFPCRRTCGTPKQPTEAIRWTWDYRRRTSS